MCFQNKQQDCTLLPGYQSFSRKGLEIRQQKLYVQHMSEVISTLEQAFTSAVSIRRVLILVGSTSVLPKESYMIQFPTSLYSGKILTLSQCKAQLFRELTASPFFVESHQLRSCARVFVLLEMPEEYTCEAPIIPKPRFKLPSSGSRLSVHFIYPNNSSTEEWSRPNETEFNISGVEPLNASLLDVSSQRSFIETDDHNTAKGGEHSFHSMPACRLHTECHGQNVKEVESVSWACKCETPAALTKTPLSQSVHCDPYDLVQTGYLWYQLPTCIKGYKDRTTKPGRM